jgi:hypothetical protein
LPNGSRFKVDSNREAMFMKLLLSALAVIAASAALGMPAQAQNYPWCVQYSDGSGIGGTNCGYVSFAQCMATASGAVGFCVVNTQYQAPPGRHPQRRHPY